MSLGTHAVVGAAVASFLPAHPLLGFCAGFASHFLADAIPHYDYPILSDSIRPQHGNDFLSIDANFMADALHFSADAGAGLLLSFLLFAPLAPLLAIFIGATGGVMPDPLQFVSKKWPVRPLRILQRFHEWIHTGYRMRERGEGALGVISQLAFIAAIAAIAFAGHKALFG